MTGSVLRVMLAIAASCLALEAMGCGGARAGETSALRHELAAAMDAARGRAAPTVADAEAAFDAASRAEAEGDAEAAAEHGARARLLSAQATAVAEGRAEDEARALLEAETAQLLEEALAIEDQALTLEANASRLAAARAARDEGLRALLRAEADESRRGRSAHLSLDDAAAMRNAARDIRRRARTLLSAALAIGRRSAASALPSVYAETERLLAASEESEDPLTTLRLADEAHDAARVALGQARRGRPVTAAGLAALMEACQSEGFEALLLEQGVALDLSTFFASTGRTPSRDGAARLHRLGVLLLSHPEGPVVIDASGSLGAPRARAVRAALIAAGLPDERIEESVSDTGAATRLVLSSYAAATPATAARLIGEPSATSAPPVIARPAPAATEE